MRISDSNINLALKISEDFRELVIENNFHCILKIIELCISFKSNYIVEKSKLPSTFNAIDELNANENAHSKLLAKLFNCKIEGGFYFFNSFIDVLNKDCGFQFDNKIKKPYFTQEKERIDICIEDEDYIIIIENKIHHATDQNEQIDRYITLKEYLGKTIYVIYLTGWGGSPPLSSFSLQNRNDFILKKRYIEPTFRDDILPWLIECQKNLNLPNKDYLLKVSIDLYIDHLKGLFNKRTTQMEMDRKLIETLKSYLIESSDESGLLNIIRHTSLSLDITKSYLEFLWINQINEFYERIKLDYPQFTPVLNLKPDYPKTGIKLNTIFGEFSIIIELTPSKKSNIGISTHECEKNPNIVEELKSFLSDSFLRVNEFGSNSTWYHYTYIDNLDQTYGMFKKQVDMILEKLAK